MARKQALWKTKGMNRDLSVSAFSPEFSFENMNLRLSTNEHNTTLSWVNEKGTRKLSVNIDENPWIHIADNKIYRDKIIGVPIGTAVMNDKLVLFTTCRDSVPDVKPDRIYVLWYKDSLCFEVEGKLLYMGNLNFNYKYPIETHTYYEAEHIQKVYWTDGLNQPRLINIAASDSKLEKWNSTPVVGARSALDTFFDFVPQMGLGETMAVSQDMYAGGMFAPGVIQYCFTYINKYGQQSNISQVSPLYYLTHSDRGASPEDKVSCSFTIKISNPDKNFDYIRLYSIQRTSINNTVVKLLDDIPVSGTTVPELYTTKIIYSDDETLTLPRDSKGRIKEVVAANGDYSLTIPEPSWGHLPSSSGYPNSCIFTIVGISEGGPATDEMDLQELINLGSSKDFECCDDFYARDYYYEIRFDQDLNDWLTRKVSHGEDDRWGIKITYPNNTSTTIEGNNENSFYESSLIYSYKDQKWYFSDGFATVDVTKEEKSGNEIVYIDNGTTGAIVDPNELLFVGGKEITALTMADKDNTLFLGNIEQVGTDVSEVQDYFDEIRDDSTHKINITFAYDHINKKIVFDVDRGYYAYSNTLSSKNSSQITTLKGGEMYRFGFQLQKNTGEWTEPIFIDDRRNTVYPRARLYESDVNLVSAFANIPITGTAPNDNLVSISSYAKAFDWSLYRKIRPVIVYPNPSQRSVLCQGVLNPTVFNVEDRETNSPYAQPSWYYRPYRGASHADSDEEEESIVDSSYNVVANQYDAYHDTDVDFSGDPYFRNNGLLKDYYVIVIRGVATRVNSVLENGYITVYTTEIDYDPNDRTNPHGNSNTDPLPSEEHFSYAIRLYTSGSGANKTHYVALLRDTPWPVEYDNPINYNLQEFQNGGSLYYDNAVHVQEVNQEPFKFYKNMNVASNKTPYYTQREGYPENYVFRFWTDGQYYTVTFTSLGEDYAYIPNAGINSGQFVNYIHYNSLDCKYTLPNNTSASLSNIEIQDAQEIYETPFSENRPHPNNNTQFFVDQSIVTLNSPDIEFDTNVQSYATEGLRLRIVGVIPITANVSSHNIETYEKYLDTNHHQTGNNYVHVYGGKESSNNVLYNNISVNAGLRLVTDYLWSDVNISKGNDGVETAQSLIDYVVFPWHRSGPLNNDYRNRDEASSWLRTKKESNLLFSSITEYLPKNQMKQFSFTDVRMHLQENDYQYNIRLPKQKKTTSTINYFPNIKKVLYNMTHAVSYAKDANDQNLTFNITANPILMQYKSGSHAVISLNSGNGATPFIPILPYGYYTPSAEEAAEYLEEYGEELTESPIGKFDEDGEIAENEYTETFWGDTEVVFGQDGISLDNMFIFKNKPQWHNFLWLGELYRDIHNPFGNKTREAVKNNVWQIAGEPVDLYDGGNLKSLIRINWTYGDTYYQRYDSLKTYAYTQEDPNQIVEILSFMCETRVNIDGRYDKNRGQMNNYNMSPQIFNSINPVYSQSDNFFTYRKLDTEENEKLKYPNQICYTGSKTDGSDVDEYTHITLASVLSLDGDKGEITSLQRLNDQIFAFQDKGISQVLYNERAQISTADGVPIELANSGKVEGSRYITDTIGCSDKWSIAQSPMGVYFADSVHKNLYLFNGQLTNLSTTLGFNTWSKKNLADGDSKWNPVDYANIVSYYDYMNQDVLFINKAKALAYSEKTNTFTSFYDYGEIPYFVNLNSTGIWLKHIINRSDNSAYCDLWKHQDGSYCNFFGINKPYWMTLVGNPEPQTDKIFTNLEFRATVDNETSSTQLPFDSLETWDEYQHGKTLLQERLGRLNMQHHTPDGISSLKRKFRIWRCDIPRDNVPVGADSEDEELGISRIKAHPIDRMRNPWLYLKLFKSAAYPQSSLRRTEIHDLMMTYYN